MATERRAWSWRQKLLKSSLPGTTRHVLLTLSCHVNDAGEACFPSIADLVSETGLSKPTVLAHLDSGQKEGWIEVRRHGFSGQKWARNEYLLAWPEDGEGGKGALPPSPQGGKAALLQVVKEVDHLQGSPYIRVFPCIPKTPISPDGDDAGFERFWQTYPKSRRLAKAKCKRLWERKRLEPNTEQVIRVLLADAVSPQWCKDDGQFVPLPATWLGQDRFDREPATLASAQRACSVCGGVAGYKVGGREYCQTHFREKRE